MESEPYRRSHCTIITAAAAAPSLPPPPLHRAIDPAWLAHILRPDPPPGERGPLDPCPRDTRQLWSSIAAVESLRNVEKADPAAARAGGVAERLVKEREAAVCELVAAKAKQALRSKLSTEV